MDQTTYAAAIDRNIAELERAKLNAGAMTAMEQVGDISHMTLRVIYFALFNDYIAHSIKVLDQHRDSASFWTLDKVNRAQFDVIIQQGGIDLTELQQLSNKLKHVRDKTHFHIDLKAVLNPKKVWEEAGINGKQLAKVIAQLWALMNDARVHLGKRRMEIPTLDLAEISRITAMMENGTVPGE